MGFPGPTGATGATGTSPSGSAGQILAYVSGAWVAKTPASVNSRSVTITRSQKAAGVHHGIGASITPTFSGRLHITASYQLYVAPGGAGYMTVGIRYGTGSAPAALAALTGTDAGANNGDSNLSFLPANTPIPGATSAVVTGLTVGTTYWLDLSLYARTIGYTDGDCSCGIPTLSAHEF